MQNPAWNAFRLFRQSRQPLQLAGRKRTWQRTFHSTPHLDVVKPFVLADIGEGITEVQIIQWFVQPGARVRQFDKLCEVQSDKASVEITSRFDGVIKKLHYEQDDTAKVGKPLCDIDIEGEISPKDEALVSPEGEQAGTPDDAQQPQKAAEKTSKSSETRPMPERKASSAPPRNRHASNLATPAVRGLLKELDVRIEDVEGTGRDGRVLKEDVHNFVTSRKSQETSASGPSDLASNLGGMKLSRPRPATFDDEPQQETSMSLTPIQAQMFKVMTRSLSIPHFLYADEIDLTALTKLRQQLNNSPTSAIRLSILPFVIKAVSLALKSFPILNSRVEASESSTSSSPSKLILREKHNIGIAMDTPQGLLVPNIKNVASLSINDIAEQLAYLQQQAKAGKLTTSDLTGGTITVSNIGSIGGTYVAPVIVQSEVAILGIGKARAVPSFDEQGNVVRKMVGNFSWSADHRVVDGATMARMGERVRTLVEEPGKMMAEMR